MRMIMMMVTRVCAVFFKGIGNEAERVLNAASWPGEDLETELQRKSSL